MQPLIAPYVAEPSDSERIPVVRLTRIFRQAMTSQIITNAHRINQGYFPDISNGRDTDFFFIQKEDPSMAAAEQANGSSSTMDLLPFRLYEAMFLG